MPDHEPGMQKSSILYYDANNLYGWAMSQSLPTGAFEWVDQQDAKAALDQTVDAKKFYILQVNLE